MHPRSSRLAGVPAALIGAALVAALSGCAAIARLVGAYQQCQDVATLRGEDLTGEPFHVSGAFATTVDRLRAFHGGSQLDGPPGDEPAVLCWIDGEIPKGPPPDPDREAQPGFNRSAIAVVGGQQHLLIAGYKDRLQVQAP